MVIRRPSVDRLVPVDRLSGTSTTPLHLGIDGNVAVVMGGSISVGFHPKRLKASNRTPETIVRAAAAGSDNGLGLWEIVEPLLPPHPPRPKGGRRPVDDRACL